MANASGATDATSFEYSVCKRVRYCDDDCLEKDKRFHNPNCSAQVDGELNAVQMQKSRNAKDGLVGLANLGNTCYMASSL